MAVQRLQSILDDGEALRFNVRTRGGETVGLTDERLLLARDDEVVSVPLENVREVTIQSFDWFLGVLSLVLVGFGVVSIPRNVLGGVAFAAAGAVSLYLTYRKRGRVKVKTHSRPQPLTFYLDETDPFEAAFERRVEVFEARREEGEPRGSQG